MDRCTINVTGESSVNKQPDQATVSFSVSSRRDEQSNVVSELSERSDSVLQSLEDRFEMDEEVKSTGYTVNDARSRTRNDEPPEYDYVGKHSYEVTVDDLSIVGNVVDTVINAGATSVGNIEFGLSDPTYSECRDEAIRLAVQHARHEAEVAADVENLEIFEPSNIDIQRTMRHTTSRRPDSIETLSVDSGETEVENEDVTVEANVSVEYELI